jgi:hypothetical protein
MTRSRLRLAAAALVVVTGVWGCAPKPLDRTSDNRPWNRKDPTQFTRLGCRILNKQPTVTLMFYRDAAGDCVPTPEYHNSLFVSRRGLFVHWELCNTCDAPIEVALRMRGWVKYKGRQPAPEAKGPWLVACAPREEQLAPDDGGKKEVLRAEVSAAVSERPPVPASPGHGFIHCEVANRAPEVGDVFTYYFIDVQEKGKKVRSFNQGGGKIVDY